MEKDLKNLKQWIEIDVRSPTSKNTLLDRVNYHIENPDKFSPTVYDMHSHKLSKLGQTSLHLTTIQAVCKFKRALKK